MSYTTFKATAHLQKGIQVKVNARDFEVIVDESKELGGTDTGMNPIELILASLGSCLAIVASAYAEKHRMLFSDFRVELEGDMDTDGFLGFSDVKKSFNEIRYNIHIETNEPIEKVEKFITFIQETCPITDTIASPIPAKLNKLIINNTN